MGRKRSNPADAQKLAKGLYLGPSGWYFARFWFDGKRYYKRLGTHREHALGELQRMKDDVERGAVGRARICRATMADLWEDYHESAILHGKKSLERDVRTWHSRLAPVFGKTMISRVGKESVQDYLKERRKTVAPATCNRERALLSSMLTYAVENQSKYGLERNPLLGLAGFAENNARKPSLSDADEDRLLAECIRSGKKAPYMHDLVLMALRTGARLSELVNLRWSHVDLRQGVMRIMDTKNTETRTVPLSDDIVALLKARQEVGTGFVLTTRDKTGIRPEAASQAFRRISQRLKLPGGAKKQDASDKSRKAKSEKPDKPDFLHFHDLRHVCGERLLYSGANVIAIMDILGHKSTDMVKRYAMSRPADLATFVNAAALKGAKPTTGEKKA